MVVNLSKLKKGQSGIVVSVDTQENLRRRITDMGLTPGCPVLMRRIAPLGDPLQISARGYELSLRRREAERIAVELEERP